MKTFLSRGGTSLKPLAAASLVLSVATSISSYAGGVQLRVTNPTDVARMAEVLDIPLGEVQAHLHSADGDGIAAQVAGSDKALLTQLYATKADGPPDRLLVLLDIAPLRSVTIELSVVPGGKPPAPSLVRARQVPERKDDFAWENNVVAYRVYGPALQATGEITSGIDVWSKRVPDFVTETWYQRDLEGARTHNPALSYHKDNGQGLDSYEVGSSRGCGGTAVFEDGKLVPAQNAISSKIFADGPIRVDFELDYAPWKADGTIVRETKRITLDAGAKLNRMRSTFQFVGPSTITVAAGLAMHHDAVLQRPGPGMASVWDTPQLVTAGRIGTAMILPSGTHARLTTLPLQGKIAGHVLFLFDVHGGNTIDYFAGTAWSEADTPTQADFNSYLKQVRMRMGHPVQYRWLAVSAR